jgi:hypothetical protein
MVVGKINPSSHWNQVHYIGNWSPAACRWASGVSEAHVGRCTPHSSPILLARRKPKGAINCAPTQTVNSPGSHARALDATMWHPYEAK